MQTFAVEVRCVACGGVEYIYVEPMDYVRWNTGQHAQDAFPYLTVDERDALIASMCLDCIDEMYRDLREDDDYDGPLDPESDYPEYDPDYYVDRDCD